MNKCFSSYSGWGNDAKLKTPYKRREEAIVTWEDNWNDLFSEEYEVSDPREIREIYLEFVKYFAKEIGIGLVEKSVKSGQIPGNIN